jgi:hypothetical protein
VHNHRRRNALAHDPTEKFYLDDSTEWRAVYAITGKKLAIIVRRRQKKAVSKNAKDDAFAFGN